MAQAQLYQNIPVQDSTVSSSNSSNSSHSVGEYGTGASQSYGNNNNNGEYSPLQQCQFQITLSSYASANNDNHCAKVGAAAVGAVCRGESTSDNQTAHNIGVEQGSGVETRESSPSQCHDTCVDVVRSGEQ